MNKISDIDRQKTCWQKKVFYSLEEAQFTIKIQKRKYGANMEIYQCPFCEFWHLTKKDVEVK